MKREEIAHLATLSRIRLSDEETVHLEAELSSIVEYVSVITDITADETVTAPQVGVLHNVFRQDEVTNRSDQYTKDILAEAPTTEGRYLSVKKILDTGE